jgi:hypothetical protein
MFAWAALLPMSMTGFDREDIYGACRTGGSHFPGPTRGTWEDTGIVIALRVLDLLIDRGGWRSVMHERSILQ